MPGVVWDKVFDFADERVVQCEIHTVKNTSLEIDDNDDCK